VRHRLFLGLPFPQAHLSKLGELKSKIRPNLHWERTEKLHLALNFLGNITDEELPRLQPVLASTIKLLTPIKIHFGFLQAMYQRHEGSFLCLTPDQPAEELLDMQQALKDAVYHLDIPVADRFWPHVTIARIPKADPVTTKSILDKIDSQNLKVRFTWEADSIVLYESSSDRTGVHYSRMATYKLI